MSRPVLTKKLIVIIGATAVGKTDISLRLASIYQCPVLSADSRQCYKELGVATAKPTQQMLSMVKHHFIDTHSINSPINVAGFEKYALDTLQEVYQKHSHCIMTGGSGLYVNAVCDGLDDIPAVSVSIRHELEERFEKEGLEPLVSELQKLDPVVASDMDTSNPRRIIRALEVSLSTGKPFSSFRKGQKVPRIFETIKVGLYRDRDDLYHRINQRVDEMIDQGIFKEAAKLFEFRNAIPLQTVGYQEIFGYLDNQYDRDEAIRLIKRNSRRYAKRQLTWFTKDPSISWYHADDRESIINYLTDQTPVS